MAAMTLRLLRGLAAALVLIAGPACGQPQPQPEPQRGAPAAALRAAEAVRSAQPAGRQVLPDVAVPSHYAVSVTPDAGSLSFTGRAAIDLEVRRATDVLTLNAAGLEITDAQLSGTDERPTVSVDERLQRVSFRFRTPLQPGRRRLEIGWRGRIAQSAQGLFALDYPAAGGRRERALFTQFEPADARRFVPCFDEPALKATFDLEVTAPADRMVVSNMPVAGAEDAGGGMRRTRFARTPQMSTYLLFLAVGDFERISRRVGTVDVGVITRRGAGESGRYALDAAARLLPWYDRYFGTPYPLPKLDMIAGPGGSQFFGAMENWGAIFYFERVLLADPRFATEAERQRVFGTVAHEIAHQWFGNLVTMRWWDDLWLNEGFASWMATRVTAELHPEWSPWLQAQLARERAMRLDARATTHPVIQRVDTAEQAAQAFDRITYDKGQAVIRMLEAYVGPERFRAGVQAYMRAHAYGNTETEDLWRALEGESGGRPVLAVARDFTTQPGIPLAAYGNTEPAAAPLVRVRNFGVLPPDARAPAWRVPVAVRGPDGRVTEALLEDGCEPRRSTPAPPRPSQGLRRDIRQFVVVTCEPAPRVIEGVGAGPALINAGHAAYLRVAYADPVFARLIDGYARLPAADQLGLLTDGWALGRSGAVSWSRWLDMTARLPADADPVIWAEVARLYAELDGLYADGPERARMRAFGRAQLGRAFSRLGWSPRRGESANAATARNALIVTLARLDDPGVVSRARSLFEEWRARPDSLTPDLRQASLAIVSERMDGATWAAFREQARRATTPRGQETWWLSLADARDPALARRTLDAAVAGEPPATLVPQIVSAVAARHPDLVFGFALENAARLDPLIEASSRTRFVPRLAAGSSRAETARTLEAWAERALDADARRPVREAVEQIEEQAAARARLADLDRWLRRRS